MRILVTGSAGFMGSWIAEKLYTLGHKVYGVDDLSGGKLENWQLGMNNHFEIDLASSLATRLIYELEPEIIFYLASSAREGASQFDPVKITQTNYWAYINTLETAIKTKKLKKMIVFGSMAVYGAQETPFREDMSRLPEDIYAINKTAMEHSTEILSKIHNFNYTIIRPHNVFGERQAMYDPYRNCIAIFMNRILRGEPIYIYGDGKQMRAFSYIMDSLDCYVECMEDKHNGEIYNVGGIQPISINELVTLVINEFKEYPKSEIIHLPDRPCEVKIAYCDQTKSIEKLGYKEHIGYAEGIKRMAEWAKEEGAQNWKYENLALEESHLIPKTWKEKL